MRNRYWDITFLFSLICSLLINSGMVGLVVLHTQPPTAAELNDWRTRAALAKPAGVKPPTVAEMIPPPAIQPPVEASKPPPAPPKLQFDERDDFGENGGIGEALNSTPGDQPMEAANGPQVQAYLGRTSALTAGGGGGSSGASGATMIGAVSPAAAATPIVKAPQVPVKVPPPPQRTQTAVKPPPDKPQPTDVKPAPPVEHPQPTQAAANPPLPKPQPTQTAAKPQTVPPQQPTEANAKPTNEKPQPKTDKPAGKEVVAGDTTPIDEMGTQPLRPPPSAPPASPPPPPPPPPASPPPPPPAVTIMNDAPTTRPVVQPMQLASAVAPSQPNRPNQPSQPGRPGPPGPPNASPEHAPASDKDSDPFSDSNSFHFVNGKVSARNGRWVKTVKPQLSQAGWIDASLMANPSVVFLATVDEQGNVINVARYHSSGSDNIDLPCEQALNEWKIEPSKDKDGKPVKDVVAVSFGFQ
jgi:hypothetical protein